MSPTNNQVSTLYAYGACEHNTGVRSGMGTGTRATVRMEEQMALLMQKLVEQSQQIKLIPDGKAVDSEDMERRQYQMEKNAPDGGTEDHACSKRCNSHLSRTWKLTL